MDTLLIQYCNLFKIRIEDFKGKSHADGLPIHRHIFYYCVKTQFPSVRLKHIAKVANKKFSGVGYGIRTIEYLVTPINKNDSPKNLITTEMQTIKNRIDAFLKICDDYEGNREYDTIIPKLRTRYCNFFNISETAFNGDSQINGLPTFRHIFYYCIKTKYANLSYWQLAEILQKKSYSLARSYRIIHNIVIQFSKTDYRKSLVTADMQIIKDRVNIFLNVCKEYKETDLKLPEIE